MISMYFFSMNLTCLLKSLSDSSASFSIFCNNSGSSLIDFCTVSASYTLSNLSTSFLANYNELLFFCQTLLTYCVRQVIIYLSYKILHCMTYYNHYRNGAYFGTLRGHTTSCRTGETPDIPNDE